MKNFGEFITESDMQDESKMSLREVKLKFLTELIEAGLIKPTMNPESFQNWLDKNVK
jgi:hypothetical protein